jgi:ATP-binding cassette, subfamily B, bacterial
MGHEEHKEHYAVEPSGQDHADRIYVLSHGAVIESGTHASLMELGGQYADLYTLQASQYAS